MSPTEEKEFREWVETQVRFMQTINTVEIVELVVKCTKWREQQIETGNSQNI